MKNSFAFVAALAGLATAQQIDISAINAAPAPSITAAPVGAAGQGDLTYNSAAAAESASAAAQPTQAAKVKRGDCAKQPDGTGPAVRNPDTAEAFQNSPYFAFQANSQVRVITMDKSRIRTDVTKALPLQPIPIRREVPVSGLNPLDRRTRTLKEF